MIVIFEGPEKAGKSTIISKVRQLFPDTQVRPWGRIEHEDEYWAPLLEDAAKPNFVLWDRGWASEHVYANLMARNRNLRDDPWLGEWRFGRLASLKIMIVPGNFAKSASLRDETDLPVDPYMECQIFEQYGRRFGYHAIYNDYTERSDEENVDKIHKLMIPARYNGPLEKPYWLGPRNAKVVFVTKRLDGFMPFTGELSQKFARQLGDYCSLQCGWAEVGVLPELLRGRLVISIGDHAKSWCDDLDAAYRFHMSAWDDPKLTNQILETIKEMFRND